MKAKDLGSMRREAKKRLEIESEELLRQSKIENENDYRQLKKIKWWHLLISTGLLLFGIGFSFLVGYLVRSPLKNPGWQGAVWFTLSYTSFLFLIWLILGAMKNRRAMQFYQDRRYRYRPTFQANEARIKVVRRIILISLIPLSIFLIVLLCVF